MLQPLGAPTSNRCIRPFGGIPKKRVQFVTKKGFSVSNKYSAYAHCGFGPGIVWTKHGGGGGLIKLRDLKSRKKDMQYSKTAD